MGALALVRSVGRVSSDCFRGSRFVNFGHRFLYSPERFSAKGVVRVFKIYQPEKSNLVRFYSVF